MKIAIFLGAILAVTYIMTISRAKEENSGENKMTDKKENKLIKDAKVTFSEEELKNKLTPEQFKITQQCGTEPAFTGKYYAHKENGTYLCVVCGNKLFSSDTKYESGSGWPSFFKPIDSNSIDETVDTTFGMHRTELKCADCGAHLGHVFTDGPNPTGLRYCINSGSLDFKKDTSSTTENKKE